MRQFILMPILLAASAAAFSQSPPVVKTNFASSFDETPIAYEVHGKGSPALVFVHGWSCDRTYWKGQLSPFAESYKVVTIDLAGHGASGLGRQAYTIYSFGSDVAAVVKKLGLQRVILVGHSMGGDVIADAARQLPGRVAALVMVDTYKRLGTVRTPEQIEAFVNRFRTHFADSVRPFVRRMFLPNSDTSLVEYVAKDM